MPVVCLHYVICRKYNNLALITLPAVPRPKNQLDVVLTSNPDCVYSDGQSGHFPCHYQTPSIRGRRSYMVPSLNFSTFQDMIRLASNLTNECDGVWVLLCILLHTFFREIITMLP